MKIISVHTPKAAGTSFLKILKNVYGEEGVLEDYSEDPANPISKINLDPNYYERNPICNLGDFQAVHGHFKPDKYINVADTVFITFLREPVENVISIYLFWKGMKNCSHALHDYFSNENLSIIELAELPAIKYLYSKSYFGSFNLNDFAFIGDYAIYNQELGRLGRIFGKKLINNIYTNKTVNVFPDYEAERYNIHKRFSENLQIILREDIELYDYYKGK